MKSITIAFAFILLFFIILSWQTSEGAYAPDEVDIEVSTDKLSYKQGDILTIKGEGAHSYTVSIKITSPTGEKVTQLKIIAGNKGEFSTAWIIPTELEEGQYTVDVWDIIKQSQTQFYVGDLPYDDTEQSSQPRSKIPDWVKNNARWWSQERIGENDFLLGIQYMIKRNIISIPDLPEIATSKMELKDEKRAMGLDRHKSVPDWVKNNAGWWADGLISEDDFVSGIKYLVEQGIIQV